MMYICRVSGFVSGKTYNNACHYSAAGQENVITIRYEVLLSDVESEWRSFDEVKRSEIKKHAIAAGTDSNTKDSLYICLGTWLMAGIPGNCRIAETTPGKLYNESMSISVRRRRDCSGHQVSAAADKHRI